MKTTYFFLLLFIFTFLSSAQTSEKKDSVPFNFKVFHNLAECFSSKQEVIEFFDFKAGDTIADIGAGNGKYGPVFSLLYDSLVFYLEEIDSKVLNEKKLEKHIKHYSKLKGSPLSNRFHICIGEEKKTNLNDGAFDKIIILSAFHEFTFVDEMLLDIKSKLKPGGKIYILDARCLAKGHRYYSPDEVIKKVTQYGFKLEKSQNKNPSNNPDLYKLIFVKQ